MKNLKIGISILVASFFLAACGGSAPATTALDQAKAKAKGHNVYVPHNDVEFNNYNNRQKLADDPTTIIWCTASFNNPSSPIFTVPIVGKLTSGTKRPYPTTIAAGGNNGAGSYYPELPGPDGMYGPSDPDYRYGFTPGGQYWDFNGMQMACTTEPTVWQRQSTTLVAATDPTLVNAQTQAQAALKAGNSQLAQQILENAISSVSKP